MFESIQWQAFLKVAREEKVARLLHHFSEAAEREMTLQACERHWQDKALFDVRFTSPLGAETVREAVFETLCVCRKILNAWTVSGPDSYADGQWEFRGYSMNLAQGITRINFRIDNFTTA